MSEYKEVNIDARKEAYRIVIELLSEVVNEDRLPVASLEPDFRREVTNKIIGMIDQMWDEYHELSWTDAMSLFPIIPRYED